MGKVEIKLNHAGIEALLRSQQIEADMRQIAGSKAGTFRVGSKIGTRRARAYISTRNRKAIEDNTLIKQVFGR
jgi:hypothetical protein